MKKFLILLAFILAALLLGCTPPPEATAQPGPMGPKEFIFGTVWFFLMALFVYYVLVLNPARLREEDRKKFIGGLQKNDEVLTSGGILGRVVSVKPDSVTIEIAPNVKVRVAGRYVHPVTKEEAPKEPEKGGESKEVKRKDKKRQG